MKTPQANTLTFGYNLAPQREELRDKLTANAGSFCTAFSGMAKK